MKLYSADICRDGGSVAATFEDADGSLLSVLLEVAECPEPGEPRRFRHLHVASHIQNGCDPRTVVAKGSREEVAFLSKLDAWIAGTASSDGRPKGWHRVLELRELLASREI
ncbi:MAG TPA: hypothetical protein VF702_03355 [Allosphingosinicella sp.]|jgi:hypothetical protein